MGNNEFKLTKLALALGVTLSLSGCLSDDDKNDTVPEPPAPTQDVAVPPTAAETQAGAITVNLIDALGEPLADTVSASITFTSSEDGLLSVSGESVADEDKVTTEGTFSFTDTDNSSFTFDLEYYSENDGAEVASNEWFVSHRNNVTGDISAPVMISSMNSSSFGKNENSA